MAKVLIVDDAAFMRMRCARILTENGHAVVEASNGARGVETYEQARPDAVLLDVTMPEMDGLAALREIRRLDPNARVAMVTAMGQQGVVVDALKSGARDFVIKPFETERLLSAVTRLLS